ncbi:2-oxo-4-hydroxy-4-carboxy-5-ureidoimidazoline decarboxylase [Phenylobacterium aquaticum]|uniref:2-oxo-4-hydroxy-4-carboxy-5-ureidoimidazoline decarboxylase n=1 Tax=Phenylobacterium aquaticum TaxID=1763816 RepID=UPI00301491E7
MSPLPATREAFLAAFGHLYEHSPWVAERAWAKGPFAEPEALKAAFQTAIADASTAEQLALLRAHPQLADKAAIAQGLTADSAAEQASAGLDRLTEAEFGEFHALNAAYAERFGFPFIICVRLHDKAGILAPCASVWPARRKPSSPRPWPRSG